MDGVILVGFALVLTVITLVRKTEDIGDVTVELAVEDVTREARINDVYYHDDNAFMRIANELGFK